MVEKDPFLNRTIDEYKVEALLGVGGMARVYRGVDTRLKRYVAIKIIGFPHQYDESYITRFEREAQVIALFSHPNIVPLYRYGEIDGFLYMVMQYIDGSDLHTILSSYRNDAEFMEPKDVLHIITDVCNALDYVHSRGVVHRDIKPGNILLDKEGRAFLSDFGLALIKEVGTLGEIFGSPQYISPEQTISSAKAESRSDLYSVGVILFEIFTGQLPFEDSDPVEQALKHLNQPVPPPRSLRADISPQVEAVILKALEKNPDDRYSSGAALVKALSAALQDSVAPAAPPPSTLSSLTIAERVRLQVNSQPLPVLAAPNNRPASPRRSTEADIPPTSRRSKLAIPCLALAALAGLLIIIFLCGWSVSAGIRFGSQLLRSNSEPVATGSVPLTIQATATEPALITPLATSNSISSDEYQMQIVLRGREGLLLLNSGEIALPLERVQLGNPPNYIRGQEWELSALQPGECVSVRTKRAKDKQLKGPDCELVGIGLVIDENKPFWTSQFNIYFEDNFVESCESGLDVCEFRIDVAP